MDAGSDSGNAGLARIDPTDLVISASNFTNGTNLSLEATESLTVKAGVKLNTRKVAGSAADAATLLATTPDAPSTGNSGSISLTAPSITVERTAELDASVVNRDGTTFTAGDIKLTAQSSGDWYTTLPGVPVGFANANATIDVAGTLKGRDVTLAASIESDANFDGAAAVLSQGAVALALQQMGSPLALSLSYMEAIGDAKVTVRDTAVLDATRDISLSATAERAAGAVLGTKGGTVNLAAGFARIAGTTSVTVEAGASLTADRNIDLLAASKTAVNMTAAALVDTITSGTPSMAAIVFGGSMSDVTTSVSVADGATVTATHGDVAARAFHQGSYETGGKVTIYGDGKAGLVGALSLQKSDTSVSLGGTVTAGGNVYATALSVLPRTVVEATSENVAEAPPLGLNSLPATADLTDDEAKAQLATGFVAMLTTAYAAAESGSGSSGGASGGQRLAGAMTWSESDHKTRAAISSDARITAADQAVVDAQALVGRLQGIAEAGAEAKANSGGTSISLSAAINWADHTFTTSARVGQAATIDAGHVAVHAATHIPEFFIASMPATWDSFGEVYDNLMTLRDPLGMLYTGFNTHVSATSAAGTAAISGAINVTKMRLDTRAWVDADARITTTAATDANWAYDVSEVPFDSDVVKKTNLVSGDVTYLRDAPVDVLADFIDDTRRVYPEGGPAGGVLVDEVKFTRTVGATVAVQAENHVETLHLAGKPDEGTAAGGRGVAMGGTYSMVNRSNTAVAGIADGVTIDTRRLDVTAQTKDLALTITPSAGQGQGIAMNGMVSDTLLDETTVASISREAAVKATAGVNVNAELSLWTFGITGAVTKSNSSGVGVGVAFNELKGHTKAYIGDNDADETAGATNTDEGTAGYVQAPQVTVHALSQGTIGAVGVAGTAATAATPGAGLAGGTSGKAASASSSGGSANTAALGGATSDTQSQSTSGGGGSPPPAPAANQPPPFQIAGAGGVVTNTSDVDTTALIDGAVIKPLTGGTLTLGVRAISDLTQVSVAGGAALTKSANPATSFSATIAGAVAIQKSDDDTTARIVDSTVQDLADSADALSVEALKSGERTAAAVGLSMNLSKGSATSLSIVGAVSITESTDDTAASVEGSTISGKATVPTALDAQIVAYDRSRIGAGGGALSLGAGKGAAGVGATVSIVDLNGSTTAALAGGSMTRVHDLTVAGLSSQKVVGVGAIAGVQTDANSLGQLMGAFVFNNVNNTVGARVTGGAAVNLSGDLVLQAGGTLGVGALDAAIGAMRASTTTDYEMSSTDNGYSDELKASVGGGESIVGVAGTLVASKGNASANAGLSYVQNSIQSVYDAELNGTIVAAGDVRVDAASHANILGVTVGLGVTKGKFSGMGSATVNLIGQRTRARVTGGSVTAANLDVASGTTGYQFGFAGNVSMAVGSGSGVAGGAAVAYNQTGTRTYTDDGVSVTTTASGNAASISNAGVDVGTGRVNVAATNTTDIRAVAAAGAATTGTAAFAGTATWNQIGDVTSALVDNSLVTAGRVSVTAGEASDGTSASIQSLAGGLAASKGFAGALSLGFNTIESQRSARVTRSNLIAGSSVTVEAAAQGSIESLAVTAAAGKDGAAAGSSTANWLNADVLAEYDGDGDGVAGGSVNSLRGAATALTVRATASGSIQSMAGSLAGSTSAAFGGAIAINQMGQGDGTHRVRASLSNLDLLTTSPVAVTVQSRLTSDIGSIAAAGSGSGSAAINGSVTTNAIDATVQAEASRVRTGSADDPMWARTFTVDARNEADIASLAGTVSGGGTAAAGVAVSVNEIGGEVTARLRDTGVANSLRISEALTVNAQNSGTIKSAAAGMAAGSTAGAVGSNTTNAIHSAVLAQMSGINQWGDPASASVTALDNSLIESLAGSVGVGSTAGGGAALALNFLGRTATDEDSSKTVRAEVNESVLRVTGQVLVSATSESTIRAVGVAGGAGGTAALTGSNSTNLLEDEVTAQWLSSGVQPRLSNQLVVRATSDATIESLAGNLSGSGGVAVGAALAVNRIGTHTNAILTSATGTVRSSSGVYANDLVLSADSHNQIDTIAVGMSAGTSGAQGSVAVSVIDSQTNALLGGVDSTLTDVSVRGSVAVTANSQDSIRALAGAAGLGAGGVGLAGGVLTNIVTSETTAGVSGGTTHVTGAGQGNGLTVKGSALAGSPDLMAIDEVSDSVLDGASYTTRTVKGVAVQATSLQQIGALTAVAGGGAGVGAGAAVNVDRIGGSTRAYVEGVAHFNNATNYSSDPVYDRTPNASQSADIMAANHAMIASSTTALTAGGVGVGASVGTELIDRTTRAEITTSQVQAQGAASVKAVSTNTVAQISVGVGGGSSVGVAGSGDAAVVRGETVAAVVGSTVNADSMAVVADGANRFNLIAGSVGGGGLGGGGLSFTVGVSGSTVRALVVNSNLNADGAVIVDADNRTEMLAVSATGAYGGVGVGVAVGAAVTVMEGATEAGVKGTSSIGRRTRASGLVDSAGDAPVTLTLASAYDEVDATEHKKVRFTLNDVNGRVLSAGAVVTVVGENAITGAAMTVTAVRQTDGSYTADVSGLADGVLEARAVLSENGQSRLATTQLVKTTDQYSGETMPARPNLPTAQTRIATLSGFETVDGSNQSAVRFTLKTETGLSARADATVEVSDGRNRVTAVRNSDGSYTANVSTLGDGMLTAIVSVPEDAAAGTPAGTSRVTFLKEAGAASLSVTANETLAISHNAGAGSYGGFGAGGLSANVVVGRSTVDASVTARKVRVAGDLTVTAARDATIDMITASAGVGGTGGVAGSVGVLVFGAAPDSNGSTELKRGGDSSALSLVTGATTSDRAGGTGSALSQDELDGLNQGTDYDTTAAFEGATGGHRTSAVVNAGSVRAGNVQVTSLDRTGVTNKAGAVGGGQTVGMGLGVAVTQLGGANNASVSATELIASGNVTVESGARMPEGRSWVADTLAVQGSGGFVGVGAAVAVASNETASTASISGNVQTGGAVSVVARDAANLRSYAAGASAGGIAANAVVATATQSGTVRAAAAGNVSAQGLAVEAERDSATEAKATGGAGGVIAVNAAVALVSDSGSVQTHLAADAKLDAGSGALSVAARANPHADAYAVGVTVGGGAAVGASVATAATSTQVLVDSDGGVTLAGASVDVASVLGSGDGAVKAQAIAGAGSLLLGLTGAGATADNTGAARVSLAGGATLAATGDVSISATHAMQVDAKSTGVGAGGLVGMGVAVAEADSDVTIAVTTGALGGKVGGNLTVSGRGSDRIKADATAGAGGVVAGAGADSRVTHTMEVSALTDTVAAGLLVDGILTVSAERNVGYDNLTTTVNASAYGGSGAVNTSSLKGSATARLDDGAKLNAGQLQVLATNAVERTDLQAVNAEGGGGGVISGAGVDVNAEITGTAKAEIGAGVQIDLGKTGATVGLLELRAYNQLRGSARGRLDVGGAIPIALTNTDIEATARAEATIGDGATIGVLGEVHANALSWVDIAANTITKTYGAAAAAQGDADAAATIDNIVTVGKNTSIIGDLGVTLMAGRDRSWNRSKSFVTAQADLFNHSAIPVSFNPSPSATLTLNNKVNVDAAAGGGTAVRSGGTIQLGGIEGSVIVEGKGKVSDWTRDLGEAMGISSEFGSSTKTLNSNTVLNGSFEAGYGNQQKLVIGPTGAILTNEGNIRYSMSVEDMAATGVSYLDALKAQMARYGNVPEVKAYIEAEVAFYEDMLLREGFAERTADGTVVARANVPGTFLNLYNVRAGSGNIDLFGNNVSGRASLVARADSMIEIENQSPMNVRVQNLTVDSSGGFATYNGTFLKSASEIAALNRDVKTGLNLTVDSIDTRKAAGVSGGESLPTLKVVNSYTPTGSISSTPVYFTGPDGTQYDLREDQARAPELRVNGTLYNKLGDITLSSTAGSISVIAEKAGDQPRLDGMTVNVSAGKAFVLSSPTVSQSVGGSPESLYAVYYTEAQRQKLINLGITPCGSAEPGNPSATRVTANCYREGTGGIYSNGAIFLGARYLNINGTVQSGQADYKVDLTDAKVGTIITNWEKTWTDNRGRYLAQGRSSLVQVAGRRPSDSEADVNKRFANGTITVTQRDDEIAAIRARAVEPIVYYDAESDTLKLAPTEAKGGLVELVGSIINTGGGVVRALDGYAHFDIKNQTGYALELQGLDTGGDKGVVRITDLSKPYCVKGTGANMVAATCGTSGARILAYKVTTYQRDDEGVFKATVTAGRGGATLSTTLGDTTAVSGRPELRATFAYNPVANSTYAWSAGYDYATETRYWYQKSSYGWGLVNGKPSEWNSAQVFVKTANAMAQDIYVASDASEGALTSGGTNFSIGSNTFTTGAEKEIYFRSWSKCGFLCFKKTYYVDYRTETGKKDVFTQRVRADYPIKVELVGYSAGDINVASKGSVIVAGDITNDSGRVRIVSSTGKLLQSNLGATVQGVDLTFLAAGGIGTESEQLKVATGSGYFTATTTTGDIAVLGESGALRVKSVSTDNGRVWLTGEDGIVAADPNQAVHVRGNRVQLASARGSIGELNADGSVKSVLRIETEASAGGGVSATAARDIAIKEVTGDLWVDQVTSRGGNVFLETPGDFVDNNRNETRDLRTEAELLSLWNQAALQGASAESSRQDSLRSTRVQYRRYWSLRNSQPNGADAGSFDPTSYAMSSSEKAQLAGNGLTTEQIASLEATRRTEIIGLHAQYGTTTYVIGDDQVIAEVNAANRALGREEVGANAVWTDKELKSPLPKGIFSKSTTSTQTRIEEPNVVGNRVELKANGKVGKDDGVLTIDLLKAGGLTTADQLAIMSAEASDMTMTAKDAGGRLIDIDKLLAGELPAGTVPATWTLSVAQKDTFDVLSSRLNLTSRGFVYLGANGNATAAQGVANAGSVNIEKLIGTGEIRIKASDSILNASTGSEAIIEGHHAILEAATGSIGTADKRVTMKLTGGTQGTLVARAEEGIWLEEKSGDIRMADVFSPGTVDLKAAGGIFDARGNGTRSVEGNEVSLTALGGTVGTSANPIVVKANTSAGVNASTPVGSSIYLQGAETGLTVKNVNSGLDVELYAPSGDLRARGVVTAIGRIDNEAEGTGDFVMEGDAVMRAISGDIYVGAQDAGLSKLDAYRAVVVSARGAITDTGTVDGAFNAAGRSVTLVASGAIGTRDKPVDVLTRERTRLVATSRDAGVFVSSDQDVLRISQVSAKGDAVLSSAYDILDERGTRPQAVDAANVEFAAGGNVGQAAAPMTVKMAAGGVVREATAGGSVFLAAPFGVLTVADASAGTGQIALDGSAYGLSLTGSIAAGAGMALNAGTKAVTFGADAALTNTTGSISVKGATVTMANGATIDGGTGTVVMTATGDITLSGVSTANATTGAIVVSTTGGAVRDAGDATAYDLRVNSATGGIRIDAQGDIGAPSLSSSATGYAIETDAPVLQATSKAGAVSLAQARDTRDVNVTARTNAVLQAQGSVTGTRVVAQGGDARVASASGGVKLTTVTATQDADISAGGKIDLGSVTATRDIIVTSKGTAPAGAGRGVIAQSLAATRNLAITASGTGADASFGTLSARNGTLNLSVDGSLSLTGAVSAGSHVDLVSDAAATLKTVASTSGRVLVDAGGALQMGSATAGTSVSLTSAGNLAVGTYTAKAGGATAKSGGTLTQSSASATGDVVIEAVGNATLGTVTSSGGAIDAGSTGGALSTGAVTALTNLKLKASGNLSAGALTSRNTTVQADSLVGSVSIDSVTARNGLTATAAAALALRTFTVSAGAATLRAGTDFTATTGSASGIVDIRLGGIGTLGSLTSTGASVSAITTGKGLSFGTLKAARGITLRAQSRIGLGTSAAFAVVGTTLDAGTGAVDVETAAGDVQVGTLKATLASRAVTGNGNLKITTVTLPKLVPLTTTATGGTRTVPVAYR